MSVTTEVQSGLEGVVAFARDRRARPGRRCAALPRVDIEELAGRVPFEQAWGLLVDGRLLPGLPPEQPHASSVRSGNPRADLQPALAMLAPQWGLRELIDIPDEDRGAVLDPLAR